MELPADTFYDDPLNASKYMVRTDAGSSITTNEIDEIQLALDTETDGVSNHRSYYEELGDINTKKQGYGITGLLSLDFLISLLAVIISAFSFSAILMYTVKSGFFNFTFLLSVVSNIGHPICLLISKDLIELMGGSIGVESKIGTGSRFWIKIPLL